MNGPGACLLGNHIHGRPIFLSLFVSASVGTDGRGPGGGGGADVALPNLQNDHVIVVLPNFRTTFSHHVKLKKK